MLDVVVVDVAIIVLDGCILMVTFSSRPANKKYMIDHICPRSAKCNKLSIICH